jgi:hypothetical protein
MKGYGRTLTEVISLNIPVGTEDVHKCLNQVLSWPFRCSIVAYPLLPACQGDCSVKQYRSKSIFFWDMTPCSALRVNRRFWGKYRFHLQGRKIIWTRNQRENRWQAECLKICLHPPPPNFREVYECLYDEISVPRCTNVLSICLLQEFLYLGITLFAPVQRLLGIYLFTWPLWLRHPLNYSPW